MQRKNTIAFVLLPVFSTPLVAADSPLPPVREFYPTCQYEVIQTETLRTQIPLVKSTYNAYASLTPDADAWANGTASLVKRLREQARNAKAYSVVLTEKDFKEASEKFGYLVITAQFLAGCDDKNQTRGIPAPINARGERIVSTQSTSKAYNIEIAFPKSEGPDRPQLSANKTVSVDEGLYGIQTGTSLTAVLEKFGTPGMVLRLAGDDKLIAYGREHWLRFHSDKLVQARFGDYEFAPTLTNYIPFDDRFDDRAWLINNKMKRNTTTSDSAINQLDLRNDKTQIDVMTETYLANNQKDVVTKVIGFDLHLRDETPADIRSLLPASSGFLATLSEKLSRRDSSTALHLSDFTASPVGKIDGQDGDNYYLMDTQTLVQTTGAAISKVIVTTDIFPEPVSESAAWTFGPLFHSQPLEEAIEVSGENAFYFDQTLEVDHGAYMVKVFFEEDGDSLKADSMEVFIY